MFTVEEAIEHIRKHQERLIWSRIEKTDTCWVFTGFCRGGYGEIGVGSSPKHIFVHRAIWMLNNGRKG